MAIKQRVPMPERDPQQRARTFDEVALGYDADMAVAEAQRCIQCKKPACVQGCPVEVPIPQFIARMVAGDFDGAYELIAQTNTLPGVCGRVCPQEEQCEKVCVLQKAGRPIAIGNLERFCADWARRGCPIDAKKEPPTGFKVAVVGSGPAGLTCAGDLARMGYDVTVFEALHKAGGVLCYGIPPFRLPREILECELKSLEALGVKLERNVSVGASVTIEQLMREEGFAAVFIGSGAGLPQFMGIPGENLLYVYSANEYLTRVNLMGAGREQSDTPISRAKKVAVVGGGNVAMDAARCALRLGAEVHIIYRRSLQEMPARREEIHHAQEEGIHFELLTNPVEILGRDGRVSGLRCVRMELGEPDEKGRRRPQAIPGSEFDIEADAVIMAIGTRPNPALTRSEPRLQTTHWGGLIVNEDTGQTTMENVYAGGDAVTGAATVILAMGAGKKAAAAIDQKLRPRTQPRKED